MSPAVCVARPRGDCSRGRHDEATFGQIRGLLDVRETGNRRGFVGAVEFAGVDLADRNAGLAQRLAEGPCERLAVVIEIALRGNVLEIERVGVGLIGECRAVANEDHKSTIPQGSCKRLVVPRRLSPGACRKHCEKAARDCDCGDLTSGEDKHGQPAPMSA